MSARVRLGTSWLGRRLVGLALVGAPSCGVFDHAPLPPQGQIVLGIATDAWLPRGPGDPYEPVPRLALFERLRIELFAPGESTPCAECVRDFGIDHRTMNEGRASVGFLPRPGIAGYRARVRLYHAGTSESSAEPRPSSTLETVVALPPVGEDGIVEVHVVLLTDLLSQPSGTLDEPVDTAPASAPVGLAGTWRPEVLQGCAAPARPGEACVPGGAYWFGDPSFDVPYERLVALSPFFIDTHEVTVGEMRASGLATLDPVALTADPYLYSSDVTHVDHYCSYTQNAGAQEGQPVNCVTRDLAARFCAQRGGMLVTEAQYELVAGARRDATYPWGEAVAGCADAVFGRSYDVTAPPAYRACASEVQGVAAPGSGRLDRVAMPDGTEVLDLAGNLTEWQRDLYQDTSESCYRANPVLDPLCDTPSANTPDAASVRGEPWTDPGGPLLRAAVRSYASTKAPQNPRVGFRCARAAASVP